MSAAKQCGLCTKAGYDDIFCKLPPGHDGLHACNCGCGLRFRRTPVALSVPDTTNHQEAPQ